MSILVLYQISNEFSPHHNPSTTHQSQYNAFTLPRPPTGLTLSTIRSAHESTLRSLNPLGSSGYHWRVRIEERAQTSHDSGVNRNEGYSWWDVQDENARLPVRECTNSELKKMLKSKGGSGSGGGVEGELQEVTTKAAKGAMKYMNKAMNVVAGGGGEEEDGGERVCVIVFKLLDLTRLGGVPGRKRGRGGGAVSAAASMGSGRVKKTVPRAPISSGSKVSQQRQMQTQRQQAAPAANKPVPTANLMDFNAPSSSAAATGTTRPPLSHATSMPSITPTPPPANESRAQKLKREYAQKASTSNRTWDEVDQRWVEGPVANGESQPASSSMHQVTTSVKGIKLDATNAIGKSQSVANAIEKRVKDMQDSQAKAIEELRQREASKASADQEEELVRQRLEPKLKAWSEEHGKKKQLRALLANLHTILWEGSGWKPISLAEVLEDGKVKKVYHRASRVVHPDKTGGLDAEKRFVAKRVFDALTQAKTEFDNGAK